jgi:hypothetical protein
MWQVAAGALLGGLSGVLGNKKEGGQDAGNLFASDNADTTRNRQLGIANVFDRNMMSTAGQGQASDYSSQVMNDPMLSQLFGQGGAMSRTLDEERQLASQGFKLTDDDRNAYGQISGDIARQFDSQENGLAQALAARGMDASGAATMAFAGSQGNKMERLQKAQQSLAENRYKQNMERLGQTRQFANSLGNQALQAQGQANSIDKQGQQLGLDRANLGMDWLSRQQGANQAAIGDRLRTQHQTDLSAGLNGAIAGGMQGAQMGGGGMGGSSGGMGGTNSMFQGSPRYTA